MYVYSKIILKNVKFVTYKSYLSSFNHRVLCFMQRLFTEYRQRIKSSSATKNHYYD